MNRLGVIRDPFHREVPLPGLIDETGLPGEGVTWIYLDNEEDWERILDPNWKPDQ
jgi:hypothetical protein